MPLHELIAFNLNTDLASKKCWEVYNYLIENFENEFNVLLRVTKEEMHAKQMDDKLIELIFLNREGKLPVRPGFDGEYGKIEEREKQRKLL